jgi:phosphoribosylformylglycinamidine synthase
VGARISLDEVCERDGVPPFTALFAESTARAVVAVPRSAEARFTDLCAASRFPLARIGVVDDAGQEGDPVLDVEGLFSVPLAELASARERTLPAAFDS